jgi:hypothetical protein
MQHPTKNTPGTVFIALSGKKQVGKDTATAFAKKLLEKSGKTVGVTAFAEALKDIAINVLGVPRGLAYGSNDQKETLTDIMWDTLPWEIREKYNHTGATGRFVIRPLGDATLRVGPMTVRELLQVLGTDIFREMLEGDVWANSPFRRDWNGYDVVFITDCRFPNEARVVKERGGTIIRLERDTGFVDNHPSETALDNFDFERKFVNDGSLEELQVFIRNTLVELGLINV